MASLTDLIIIYKGIPSIEELQHAVNLKILTLRANSIENNTPLRTFAHLVTLTIKEKNILSLYYRWTLESYLWLTNIQVSQNDIQDISVFKDLKRVSIAHFEENEIEKLPEYFSNDLVYLNLNKNNLLNIDSLST